MRAIPFIDRMLIMNEQRPQAKTLRTNKHFLKHSMDMDIASAIRNARSAKGYSQRKLARMIHVSPGAVGQWENGTNVPTIENRVEISKALEIPFVDLLPEIPSMGSMVVEDPQVISLVWNFLKLPGPVREALLMQVVAVAKSLEESIALERISSGWSKVPHHPEKVD
jgi:transcriptional regulator with XRE-family HTH domain